MMKYWSFFPTRRGRLGPHAGLGICRRGGVRRSKASQSGERFYGYFPIASHVRMQPARVTARGFYDAAPHRNELISAYNQYTRCSSDPAYAQPLEGLPGAAAAALHHLLHAGGLPGGQRVLRRRAGRGVQRVEQDRLRHRLLPRPARRPAAGGGHLGAQPRLRRGPGLLRPDDRLRRSEVAAAPTCRRCMSTSRATTHCVPPCTTTSATRWFTTASRARRRRRRSWRRSDLPGPKPLLYFAPVQITKRNADWGPQEVNRRFNAAQQRFVAELSRPGNRWMTLVEGRGFEAARRRSPTCTPGAWMRSMRT